MARRISGPPRPRNGQRRIAEAQFDLNRVRHVHKQRLRLLHPALGARCRVLPIEVPKIEVHKIKEIFSPIPPESEEKFATVLSNRLPALDVIKKLGKMRLCLRGLNLAHVKALD